ncbi:MAG: hypothetical protein K5629_05910 [Eubacteriales bacterium]|nr:hypothetical protein [Eubacteriales bacterium]
MDWKKAIPFDRHFFSITELLGQGLTYYRINKLVEDGILKKLNNKTYENTQYQGEVSDFAVVAAYASKGVFCMMTAARHYELTTYLPDAVDVAIERNMKISTLPDWPSVHIWYYPRLRYETGVSTITDDTGAYRIYDIEKTVTDILYYRNKVGIEETKEILTNYLKREDRDLVRLHRYADSLGCGKILATYLEVLL